MNLPTRSLLLAPVLSLISLIGTGQASAAPLWQKPVLAPSGGLDIGIAPGPNGTLWVENTTGTGVVMNIDATGAPVPGTSVHRLAHCEANASGLASSTRWGVWATCYQAGSVQKITPGSSSFPVATVHPWGLALDPRGNLWVADLSGSVTQYDAAGKTTGVRISGLSASDHPVAIDNAGRIWVVEDGGVVQYSPAGAPTGVSISATHDVGAIAIDHAGNVWCISTGGDVLRGFSASGASLGGPIINPTQSPNRVYFATFDTKGNFWFSTGGAVQEVAGVGRTNGRGPAAAFSAPGQPTHVSVHRFANTATITFVAGREGNLPTHYLVTAYRNGRSAGVVCQLSSSRQCLVASLLLVKPYTFTVTAVNVLGRTSSMRSASVHFVVPGGLRPHAPVNLRIVHSSQSTVVLRWSPVVRGPSGPLTGYECNGGTSHSLFVTTPTCTLPRSAVSRHGGFVVLSVVSVDAAHRQSAPALIDIKLS